MKNILFLLFVFIAFISCDNKADKFSGSPIGKANFINVDATISTNETIVSTLQSFDFTATIPQVFNSDVAVEATIVGVNTSIRRAKVVIPAGQLSAVGSISAPVAVDSGSSTSTFTQSATLYLSAILPNDLTANTTYTISSNKIVLKLSDTSVPLSNSDRFIVRLDWQGPWGVSGNPLQNNLDMNVRRDNILYTTSNPANIPPSTTNQNTKTVDSRFEDFRIMNSYPNGDFTFEVFAKSIINNGDLNCRFVLVYPDDKTKTIEFVTSGLMLTSLPSLPIIRLKIRKQDSSTMPGSFVYTIVP